MVAADEGFALDDFETTAEIAIPDDPLKRVVGQDEAIALARIAANQRRHFLLVGPPGTGKSMIAQALSLHLPSVTEEIRVVHNPENPERPLIEVKQRDEVLQEQNRLAGAEGDLIDPKEEPINVAERLGYQRAHSGTYSVPPHPMVPKSGRPKAEAQAKAGHPFGDIPGGPLEAHEGFLFIDELPLLGHLQRFILTAMQEKRFPISGRNPQSAGASVKVESVPCDFIFVGACNIQDLPHILSPLRSRITGGGYEILVETTMPDSDSNRAKLAQFVAQEIAVDKRIPPASRDAVGIVIEEARRRAKTLDNKDKALSLRLRELGGLIRSAGDIAVTEQAKRIEADHVQRAVKVSRSIEDQIRERYGSYTAGVGTDLSSAQRESSPYHYWNEHKADDVQGYQ